MDKLLRLALLHDLEESITGDLTPEDKYSKGAASVKAQKLSAREQLLSGFPERNRQTYRGLWLELDADNSKEAKLVHELDKLEMALQAKEYARRGIDPVKLGQFYATAKASISDPGLREILDELAA
jgi:putative hydrolase of HD superfamily